MSLETQLTIESEVPMDDTRQVPHEMRSEFTSAYVRIENERVAAYLFDNVLRNVDIVRRSIAKIKRRKSPKK